MSLPKADGLQQLTRRERGHFRSSYSSITRLMRHHKSWHVRERLMRARLRRFTESGAFDDVKTHLVPY